MSKRLVFFTLVFVLISTLAVCMTASADFKDDFSDMDYASNGWYYNVLLGKTNTDYLVPERRRISFHLPDYDTAIYTLNDNTFAEDQTVEVTFENVYSNNVQYGVVCRYHDYGWYEFRIVVSGENAGSYVVYKYDQYLKDQGKTPYVILHPGMDRYYSYDIKLGLNVKNTLKMSCEGDEFRIWINGNEQFPIKNGRLHDSDFEDGEAGFTIWNQRPGGGQAQIDITKFNAEFDEN